jgi:hypothetical protein
MLMTLSIILNNHLALLAYTKELLSNKFEMIDSGEIACYLGVQVKLNRKLKNIHLSQEKYFNDILA